MKTVKKILFWFLLILAGIVVAVVVFRDEIVLAIMRRELSAKMDRPFTKVKLPVIPDSVYAALAADFDRCAQDPCRFIANEFDAHDIVFLGENHRIRHDLLFVHQLIPILYQKGVRNMGFEFALNKDSLLIREVITNREVFDQEKANQIIFNLSPFWGFKEYIDVFRAAWEVNRKLPEGAEPFMIYGIMHNFDFSKMKSKSDENNDSVMLKVRNGVADGDKFMAECIINDFVRKGKKALIYCGIHHAFTGYKGHGQRTGVIVKDLIGDKAMTIALHYPWWNKKGFGYGAVYPVNGYIDAFIRKHRSKDFAFGISVENTSFGDLKDTTSSYCSQEALKLSSFCDGYVYLRPFCSAESVQIQDDFITGRNVDYARSQLPNPELRDGLFRFVGPKVFNQAALMDADIIYQFRHLY